jgi:hypothetical protein
MPHILPYSEGQRLQFLPDLEGYSSYPLPTDFGRGDSKVESKKLLWRAVSALMLKHYGDENLTRLARECKFGPGTASRLKEGATSVGVDIVDKIAKNFHLQAWELLVPSFDPDNRPALQPLSEQERKLYKRLAEVAKEIKETS